VHVALHEVPFAQIRLPGQAAGVPTVQLPEPLHALGVSVLPEQDDPQLVPLPGPTHAPPALHAVAPQTPVVMHAAAQQLPVPLVPQMPDVQALLPPQTAPLPTFGAHAPALQ
jgi:hypothetical protein